MKGRIKIILVLAVFAAAGLAAGMWSGMYQEKISAWIEQLDDIIPGAAEGNMKRETAMEHARKHLDPTYYCPMHPQVTSNKPGRCPICTMDLVPLASAATPAEKEILYYRHPMDPSVTSDTPQKDSMGMDFIPVYADQAEGGPEVRIAPEMVNNLGVRTERVTRNSISRRIDTVGYVGYNESLIGHVHLRTAGWIEHLTVNTVGDRVKKGQLLFTLYSPVLVNAQEEYVQALERANERLINASREKLRALGVSVAQIDALTKNRKVKHTVNVYAHHSGFVSDLMVREGMYVEPVTETMSIVDLHSVWILAEVFERQAAWVKAGQQTVTKVPSFPDRRWTGAVDYIYPTLDPVTRTLRVRLRFDNPDELLKPNMFANVSILAEPRENVLTVPSDAVIRDATGERVIMALGEGRFVPRDIRIGIESDGLVEILEGLEEGEEVVVSSQFLLDSEASLRAGLRRMQPATEGNGPPKENMEQQFMEETTP